MRSVGPQIGSRVLLRGLTGGHGTAAGPGGRSIGIDPGYIESLPNSTITLTGDATGSGTNSIPVTLSASGVAAGSYTNTNLTVDAKGRLTAASNGSGGVGGGTVTSIATGAGLSGGSPTPITTAGTIALASPIAASFMPAYTGDVTSPAGSAVNTLANSGVTAGTYNNVTVNAKGLATGGSNVAYLTSSGISGMTAGQLPVAATATTITSSVPYGTTGNNTVVQTGATGTLAAGVMPAYTGDVTSPAGATANTLATVNSNIGTYNNITINAKGLATAGSSVAYLTGNQTITLSGDVSGSGATAIATTLATVTVPKGGTGAANLPVSNSTPSFGSTGTVLLGQGTSAVIPASAAGGAVGTFGGGNLICQGAGGAGYIDLARANGTLAAPAGVLSGQNIGAFFFDGYTSAGAWSATSRGQFLCTAAETWSGTAQGTYFTFTTTQPATLTTAERARIGQGLMVGLTTDPGAGNVNVSGGYYVNGAPIASGTVTSITAGTGITLSPSPITATGSVSITSAGVTNALLATMPANTIKGNNTASTGAPLDLTVAQTMTLLGAAPLASPAFTGTPAAPNAALNTNTTQLATTAYVIGQASTANPLMNGAVAIGTGTTWARADHVHPTDTSRAPLASPSFTGNVTAASGSFIASADVYVQNGANPALTTYSTNFYTALYAPDGTAAAACYLIGNTGNAANIARNTTHYFQDRTGATTVAQMSTSGMIIGAPTGSYKGAGTLNATAVYAGGVALTSDVRFKRDIEPLPEGCLELVSAIAPKRFRHIPDEPPQRPLIPGELGPAVEGPPGFYERRNWGFIAQEVAAAMDEAGHDFGGHLVDGAGYQSLSPSDLVAVLWKATQELSARVAVLEAGKGG